MLEGNRGRKESGCFPARAPAKVIFKQPPVSFRRVKRSLRDKSSLEGRFLARLPDCVRNNDPAWAAAQNQNPAAAISPGFPFRLRLTFSRLILTSAEKACLTGAWVTPSGGGGQR